MLRAQRAVQDAGAPGRGAGASGARELRRAARATAGRRRDVRARRRTARTLEGDRIVWSCGGWLAKLFPELVTLRVTRQELFFFDGGPAWRDAPAWVDYDRAMYGTGDLDGLGVKVAWDQEGPPLDPDAELPDATRRDRGARPRLRRRPLPRARRRAPERLEVLPLRALGRRPLHRRAAPRPRRRLDRRRRLRARLQARPGDGRADRRPPGTAARRCRRTSRSASARQGTSFRSAGSNS